MALSFILQLLCIPILHAKQPTAQPALGPPATSESPHVRDGKEKCSWLVNCCDGFDVHRRDHWLNLPDRLTEECIAVIHSQIIRTYPGTRYNGSITSEEAGFIKDGFHNFSLTPQEVQTLLMTVGNHTQCGLYRGLVFLAMNRSCVSLDVDSNAVSIGWKHFESIRQDGLLSPFGKFFRRGLRVVSRSVGEGIRAVLALPRKTVTCPTIKGIPFYLIGGVCWSSLADGTVVTVSNRTMNRLRDTKFNPAFEDLRHNAVDDQQAEELRTLLDQFGYCGTIEHIVFLRYNNSCFGKNIDRAETVYQLPVEYFKSRDSKTTRKPVG